MEHPLGMRRLPRRLGGEMRMMTMMMMRKDERRW
jgi:hypothetical protein